MAFKFVCVLKFNHKSKITIRLAQLIKCSIEFELNNACRTCTNIVLKNDAQLGEIQQ